MKKKNKKKDKLDKDKKARQKVEDRVYYLASLFGLESWTFKWGWNTEPHKDDKEGSCINTEIAWDWDYKTLTLNFYPNFFLKSYREQSEVVVHELCHFLTSRQANIIHELLEDNLVTRREAESAKEHDTTAVQMVIIRLIEWGVKGYQRKLKLKRNQQ